MINPVQITLNLSKVSKDKYLVIGSKAANLNKLIQSNFPIPEGFVLTTRAYNSFLKYNNLTKLINDSIEDIDYTKYENVENISKKIQDAIKGGNFSQELIEEIKLQYDGLDSVNVAVRSSSIAEDQPTASFAGQYDSFLNVKNNEQVLQSIKQCYASLWTSRAINYREKNNIPNDIIEMAVIVQRMIPAKCAGVLFTINPISSNHSEIVLESNYGLGESIMSGQCSPDLFTIKKPESQKKRLKIISKQIGRKNVAIYPNSSGESGIQCIDLSEEENMQSSISDNKIIELAQIGLEIEKSFNSPQDIEWAIDQKNNIYILQSRPITSLMSSASEEEIVWSRGYSDDYWNDPVTPLFFDLLGTPLTTVVNMELNSIMGYKRIDDKFLKLSKAHVYFNLNVLKRKVEYEIPTFVRNDDLLNYFPSGSGPFGKITMKNLPFRLSKRIIAEIRISIFDPDGAISKTALKYETWTQDDFSPYCNKFDLKLKNLKSKEDLHALFDLAEELNEKMNAHYRLVRYGIPVHNIGMNLMAQYLLTRFLGEKICLRFFPILISGLEHKLTETNSQISILAEIIKKSPEIKAIILDKKSEDLFRLLSSEKSKNVKEFFTKFQLFLENYGDRGFSREIFYPRWGEEPKYVFDIFKSLIKEPSQKLAKKEAKSVGSQQRAEQYVESKIRSQRFGLLKWKLFSKILSFCRTYIIFRESQRFNLDRWISRNRYVYLEIGRELANRGVFQDFTDIFFLNRAEIKDLVFQDLNNEELKNISSLIKERRHEFLKYEYIIPPKFISGSREYNDKLSYSLDSTSFKGLPASQGIITSKIHVIPNIDLISTVEAGEIIVVPRTDPGWTPVFSKIGGLITETGGILSHGAVVARENGIPAVTNITNACQIFKNGQRVTVNGYDGIITIEK